MVTESDEIRLNDAPVTFAEFRAALQRYVGQDVVLYYQREHPERPASPAAMEVINAICGLGLALAFPPEAKPTIDAMMQRLEHPARWGSATATQAFGER